MMYIRNKNGDVIQRCKNLRGIRKYVSGYFSPIIKILDITDIQEGGGKLCILFENGTNFEGDFASCNVLKDFVRRWRNVHGFPLTINGLSAGIVSRENYNLLE